MHIIGIDLGTTNCTLAYIADGKEHIEQYHIPQLISAGVQGQSLSLPSTLYFPLPEESANHVCALEWDLQRPFAIGLYARERGSEVPSQLISSAKSWLCHCGIDRRAKLLPLGNEDLQDKMSPLDVIAEILKHIREAWDHCHTNQPLEQQQILITVPASFDPSARQLVQEAAALAGYPETILLEEPQAAFYAWLQSHKDKWRETLKVGDIVLVVDVGGGTTDFSLIEVAEADGDLVLNRLAVGDHLLLGGDNIDLALAYFVKSRFEEQGQEIDEWQLKALTHACRLAKEQLLGDDPKESVPITIHGRGRKLIGGSLTTTLSRDDVHQWIVNGFIPFVKSDEQAKAEKRSGLQQIGLPYVQDPRISAQLARFLALMGEGSDLKGGKFVVPTAVLFNGGTLKAPLLRQRLIDVINSWASEFNKSPVRELSGPDYDYAVSKGAAYYGLARQGKGIRIRGGTSCSYYIGVEDSLPAIPGILPPLKAVCIAPFGMEEGTQQELKDREFALVLGEQATFRFFSCNTPHLLNGQMPTAGMIIKDWKQTLKELHPIETLLPRSDKDGKTVKVKLVSKVTELGVLELWCMAEDGRKWKLEFDLRKANELQAVCLEV